MRSSILLILGEPLAGGADEPYDALTLRPRDVERELRPGLVSDDLRRGAPRGAAVRQELARVDVRDRFRLVRIEDEEHGRGLRPTPGWHLDLTQANECPRSIARGPDPVPVDGNKVADRLLGRLGLNRLAHGARGQSDEMVAVLDFHEVVEADVAAGRLPMLESGEVVRGRRARPLADRAARDRGGVELDVPVLPVHLDHDVDDVLRGCRCHRGLVRFHLILRSWAPYSRASVLLPPQCPTSGHPGHGGEIVRRLPGSGIYRCGTTITGRRRRNSGLETRPRRVPDDRAATPAQVRAALDALSEADLVRLEKVARYRIRGLSRSACGRDHEDLLSEAIADTLDPERRRWNTEVSFVRYLIGAMRSISSHWREQLDADEPHLESELVRTSEEGGPLSPLDLVGSGAPGAERVVEAKRQLEDIEKAVAGDSVVSDILGGMRAEMSPSDIREVLDLSQTEYETAMKRFRRLVRPSAQGGSDG